MSSGGDNKFTNALPPHKDPRTSTALHRMRNLFIGVIGIVAVILLLWMWQDQNKVFECTQIGHQQSAMPSQRQNPPSFQPIINIQINDTKPVNKNPFTDTWNYNWDKLQWKNPEDGKDVPTRTIILIRHGQYFYDTGKLTDLGREQADFTGQRLKDMNHNYTSVTHSTMIRAKETTDILRKYLPNVPTSSDDMIQEGGPMPPAPTITYWGLPDRAYFQDSPRLEAAFRKYFYRADKNQQKQSFEILVGHANIFRFFTLRALQLSADAWMRVFIPHGSITVININPDSTVTMDRFGEAGYMPHNKISY